MNRRPRRSFGRPRKEKDDREEEGFFYCLMYYFDEARRRSDGGPNGNSRHKKNCDDDDDERDEKERKKKEDEHEEVHEGAESSMRTIHGRSYAGSSSTGFVRRSYTPDRDTYGRATSRPMSPYGSMDGDKARAQSQPPEMSYSELVGKSRRKR